MGKAIKSVCKSPKRAIKKFIFSLVFIIPILILKIRAGITYEKSNTIARFYLFAALYRKQYLKAIKVFFLLFFKISWKEFSPDHSLFNKKQYRIKDNTWEIGRWYSINLETLKGTMATLDTPNMRFFSIGREAIAHILKCNKFNKKVAILPNFTCFTVLDPFLQDGWKIYFYRYNEDLTIDAEYFFDVFQKEEPSICIFQPLSGMGFLDIENRLIEHAHKNGCMTVVDQTQDIYNKRNNPSVDYYCASMRKWYPFPDGAFLYSEKYIIDGCEDLEENDIYRTSMGLCMFGRYLSSVYDDPFFAYLYNFMWTFSVSYIGNTTIMTHTMSDYSRKVYSQQDEEQNSERRINNFNYIYEGIKGLKNVKPAFGNIERLNSVPLSFPVYVENRRKFNRFLLSNGITTQLLWSKPPYIKKYTELDETTEYIYRHILSLPCDQRYNLDDMKRMVDIICDYDQMV